MSIIKIPENEYEKYLIPARTNQSNQVYPLSIAEGKQSGDIFVDAEDSANSVLFWHYCGFAYLSGTVRTGLLDEVYEEFFLKEQKRRFLIITDDLTVIRYFSGKPEIETGCRIEYRFEDADTDFSTLLPCSDYRIERINRENLPLIHGRIIPSFSWESGEQFLDNGFGYIALEGDKIAAVAFSAAVSSAEVDIGVETMAQFRHKGYAKILSRRMCQEILMQGKRPVWAHAQQNTWSERTALSCGFLEHTRNMVVRKA